jgi:hypothetical protein
VDRIPREVEESGLLEGINKNWKRSQIAILLEGQRLINEQPEECFKPFVIRSN